MIDTGNLKVWTNNFGYFHLDAGVMFGNIPKKLWERRVAADRDNRIRLSTRSLLIQNADRLFLVDTGFGSKWNEKKRKIYSFEEIPACEWSFDPDQVTDIIISHLHFDHCGGLSRYSSSNPVQLELSYPGARVYLQEANYLNAGSPRIKERASYLRDDVAALQQMELILLDGENEIYPGIFVHPANGHTSGLQWVEVRGEKETVVFPSDLLTTSQHLSLVYHTGLEVSADLYLQEKQDFLTQAAEKNWITVFVHDPQVAAVRVTRNSDGEFAVTERLTL